MDPTPQPSPPRNPPPPGPAPLNPPSPGPGPHQDPGDPSLPSHRGTLLILFSPALVLGLLALVPKPLGGSPETLFALLGSISVGPLVAGWIAGGRLAERARKLNGKPSLPPVVTRLLCITASFVTAFGGCVAILASNQG